MFYLLLFFKTFSVPQSLLFLPFLLLNHPEINTGKLSEHVHKSLICLNQLHQSLGVLSALLPHFFELFIPEVLSDAGVALKLLFCFGATQHRPHTLVLPQGDFWAHYPPLLISLNFQLLRLHDCGNALLNLGATWVQFESLFKSQKGLLEAVGRSFGGLWGAFWRLWGLFGPS